MINAWNLVWIIPVSVAVGVLLLAFFQEATRDDD